MNVSEALMDCPSCARTLLTQFVVTFPEYRNAAESVWTTHFMGEGPLLEQEESG